MSHQNHPKESAIKTIRAAADKWPSSLVARSEIKAFSGGLFSPGTMANADSQGTGPDGAFRVGRKKCYPVESLCDWLIERISEVHSSQGDRVSVATAARLLGVPQKRVRQLLKAGRLKGEKVGRIWEVQADQLPRQMILPFEKYCTGGRDGREAS